MNYQHYQNKYVSLLTQYKKKELNIPPWKAYEYITALRLGMIIWSDLPPNFGDTYELPHLMDYGVDMINLDFTKTGQAKHFGPNTSVTWAKISTFIAYSMLKLKINDMILITTHYPKISNMITSTDITIFRYGLLELLDELPELIIEEKVITKIIEPRNYTIECTKIFLESFKQLLKYQLPCGMGKSYIVYNIILEDIKANPDFKYLICVPWVDLANQMITELARFNISTMLIGNGSKYANQNYTVMVCVTGSIHLITNLSFRYKFIDEAHHIEKNKSKHLEEINKIQCDRELHLSATFRKKQKLDYSMTLRDGIDAGWLSDYRLFIEYFTDGKMDQNLINLIKKNMDWTPMFIYFNTVDRARSFAETLVSFGVRAKYLAGETSKFDRDNIIQEVKDYKLPVLCLCGCLNEGISIDNLATIIFGDFRYSEVNRVQIAMRSSRLHPNKPYSKIIFPISNIKDNYVRSMIRTFGKIDSKIKACVQNKTNTRIKIDILDKNADNIKEDNENQINAEFLYRQIYDSLGVLLSKLTPDQKIDQFIEWVIKNRKTPSRGCKDQFTCGSFFDSFWIECKHHRKLDSAPYNRLLTNPIIADSYHQYILKISGVKLTAEEKMKEMIEYVDFAKTTPKRNGKKFSNGIYMHSFWHGCKDKQKLSKDEYKLLLDNDFIKEKYQKYITQITTNPKIIRSTKDVKIEELFNWVETNKRIPSYDNMKDEFEQFTDKTSMYNFWQKCKSEHKLDKDKLLEQPEYNLLTQCVILMDAYTGYINKLVTKSRAVKTKSPESIEAKINEFIQLVIQHGIPSKPKEIKNSEGKIIERRETVKFADGCSFYSYWNRCKTENKLDVPPHNKLLNNLGIKEAYEKSQNSKKSKKDKIILIVDNKLSEFIVWVNFNKRIPTGKNDRFTDTTLMSNYWENNKRNFKFEEECFTPIFDLQIVEDAYLKYIKTRRPATYNEYCKVSHLIIAMSKYRSLIPSASTLIIPDTNQRYYDFWQEVKNNQKCKCWPYSKLLKSVILKRNYESK